MIWTFFTNHTSNAAKIRHMRIVPILLVMSATVYAQEKKPFVLLPDSAARAVSHLCSREGVGKVQGSWNPTSHDIERLESELAAISRLRSRHGEVGELKGVQISQPYAYYRQYVAVVAGGHKLIYVNAFSYQPPSSWRKQLVDLCDTGRDAWGVQYDPATGHFSDLIINVGLTPPAPPPPGY